jgi:hypothetical protein
MASTETKTGDADMHPDIGAMTKGLQAEHLRRAPGSAANPRLHRRIATGSGVGAATGHGIAGIEPCRDCCDPSDGKVPPGIVGVHDAVLVMLVGEAGM